MSSQEKEGDAASFVVGQRIHSAADPRRLGTVKYIGTVQDHPGLWIGVDWDNADSGRHDGVVNGIRYFQAKSPKSASLVRSHAVRRGISFLEALSLRYTSDTTKEEEDEMYVLSTSNRKVAVEFLGKDKAKEKFSRFEELRHVSLANLGVSYADPPDAIRNALPNLKELDLTGNLLYKWQDVAQICGNLPNLEVLDLTNNYMMHDVTGVLPFRNLRVLVLNNCGMTWGQVEALKCSLPLIEELHLMTNNMTRIEASTSAQSNSNMEGFASLRILDLQENSIEMWEEVMKLSQLRSLEQLHLNKNNLKHIQYPDFPPAHGLEEQEYDFTPFKKLHSLLLGSNKIEDVESVHALNKFPNLTDIRLSDNPIADPGNGGLQRFMLVAHLEKVTILNGSEVSRRERKESEIRYVRLVMSKMRIDDKENIRKLHPRFFDLKEFHGIEDEKTSSRMNEPQKMSSSLITISLKCVVASVGAESVMTKKLPATTTVGKLKVLCQSFFKLKNTRPKLFLEEEGCPVPVLLDDDMASLTDYGIDCTGGIIVVDEE